MAMTSVTGLMIRLVEGALGLDGGCDGATKRLAAVFHGRSEVAERVQQFVETRSDPVGIGVQDVGPDIDVGAGDAHEIAEPVAPRGPGVRREPRRP